LKDGGFQTYQVFQMTMTKTPLAVALTLGLEEGESAQLWTLHPDATWKRGYIVNFFGEATEVLLNQKMREDLTKRLNTYAFPIGVDPNRHPIYKQARAMVALSALLSELRTTNYQLYQLGLGNEASPVILGTLGEVEALLQEAIEWIPEIS
jgi:hypothetical protein